MLGEKIMKVIRAVFKSTKLMVFISLTLVAFVMYQLGNLVASGIVLASMLVFTIFNKVDSMDLRLKRVEYLVGDKDEMQPLRKKSSKISNKATGK